MNIPLHIPASDRSPEAEGRRYDLHCRLMAVNSKGWRTERTARIGQHAEKPNRLRRMALASMGHASASAA